MRRYIFLLSSILVLSVLTLPTIMSGRFTFVFDMGRDLLWVRNMVELKKLTLIGPWGSIAGVFFGPLWYYLLIIPYLLFNGDPRGAVTLPLVSNIATIIIGWWWLRKHRLPVAANIFALLYSVSPLAVSSSSFAFHANLLPLTTLLFLIGLVPSKGLTFSAKRLDLKIPLAAFMASLSYHLEPATGAMLTLFLLIWFLLKRREFLQHLKTLKKIAVHVGLAVVLFWLPFTPQVIFELRHDFIQTKALLSYFKGENPSLGGELPLGERVVERITKISGTFAYSLFPSDSIAIKWAAFAVFIFALFAGLRSAKSDRFTFYAFRFTIVFLLFHYLAYALIFPAELKGWYLSGFLSVNLIAVAILLGHLWLKSRLVVVVLVAGSVFVNTNRLARLYPLPSASPAGSDTLRSQQEVVDWIYADAQDRRLPFAVYTYTPPIYDYVSQYLIWWRGKQHGFLPAEYSYLPKEAIYVPDKEAFLSPVWRAGDAVIAYLIIEPDSNNLRQQGWLGHFAGMEKLEEKEFPSGLRLEIRHVPQIR